MKIIAYWERGWFKPEPEQEMVTDYRQWEHLCRAYGIEFQMVDDWSEAATPEGSKIYLMQEEGATLLDDHKIDKQGTYVFGRSNMQLSQTFDREGNKYDFTVRIDTPHDIPMFGISAGSILLSRM